MIGVPENLLREVKISVGLAIPMGSVCGFVGPNGAGKPNIGI
jgi:ABC-type uncharacterized transport system ATPase subunit